MKPFARKAIAAQCTAGAASLASRPCDLFSMFNSQSPEQSGSLAGESFAATVESHPTYPRLRSGRHRALFDVLDDIVANHLRRIAPDLRGLGFDETGIKIYRVSALAAFRAARPNKQRAN
jgi:hypothetical protein